MLGFCSVLQRGREGGQRFGGWWEVPEVGSGMSLEIHPGMRDPPELGGHRGIRWVEHWSRPDSACPASRSIKIHNSVTKWSELSWGSGHVGSGVPHVPPVCPLCVPVSPLCVPHVSPRHPCVSPMCPLCPLCVPHVSPVCSGLPWPGPPGCDRGVTLP